MSIIEWKNPPRGVLDEADDIAKELRHRPVDRHLFNAYYRRVGA